MTGDDERSGIRGGVDDDGADEWKDIELCNKFGDAAKRDESPEDPALCKITEFSVELLVWEELSGASTFCLGKVPARLIRIT